MPTSKPLSLSDLQPGGKRKFKEIFRHAHLGGVGGDGVEDVDEDEEECDEESHPAGNHVHRNEEGYPGHDNKQTWSGGVVSKSPVIPDESVDGESK